MKKKALGLGILFVLFLALSASGMAYSPISFRIQGMGEGLAGIVDDEFTDFNLYPALVLNMSGTTLFTNLSNLGDYGPRETLGRDDWNSYRYNRGTNLVGLVTDIGGGKGGFIYEAGAYSSKDESEEAPGDFTLLPMPDTRTVESSQSESDTSFFYGTELSGGQKLGVRLGYGALAWNEVDNREDWGDRHEYSDETKIAVPRLEVGTQIESGNATFDVVGLLAFGKTESTEVDNDYYEWDEEKDEDRTESDDDGTVIGVQGRASIPTTLFGQEAVGRLFAGIVADSGEFERVREWNDEDYWGTSSGRDVLKGKRSDVFYQLGGGYQVTLGEATTLGLGLKIGGSTEKKTYTSFDRSETEEEIGLAIKQFKEDLTFKDEAFQVSLPIGLEHQVNDRLALRLGAEAFLVDNDKHSQPQDIPCFLDESDDYWNSGEDNETWAVYSVGLGYKLSDNVQLDVLHFTNLTNLKKWQMSATIKF